MPKTNGAGSIFKRGSIFWVQVYVDGHRIMESSKSTRKSDAVVLRNRLLGRKDRGEAVDGGRVLIGELLDDLLQTGKHKATTLYVWDKVIENSVRPYFGNIKASRLSTDMMERYRAHRRDEGRTDTTVNRELALVRMALNLGRKRTPPKVTRMPHFPMVTETNIRKGFLTDPQYARLRDELPQELKALFVSAFFTGIRKSELLTLRWRQVDFDGQIITLDHGETKNKEARSVPIVPGDMRDLLLAAQNACPDSAWVFNRAGIRIKDFRVAWTDACKRAEIPDLRFHDLRRTAVRNMRRAGIPQVVRMKISGHKTDSMERRYNIVDSEDLNNARELLARLQRNCSGSGIEGE
jgi:integrase